MRKHGRIWVPEAPFLNVRPTREIELVMPAARLEGIFEVELIHARTGLVRERFKFRNTITDAGLNFLSGQLSTVGVDYGTISFGFTHLAVGTGSTPPAITDTQLQTEVGRTSSNGGVADTIGYDAVNNFAWARRTRLFLEAEANGNLAELGFFSRASSSVSPPGRLMNRQLFRDGLGSATTITKTAADQLRITFEWRVYPPSVDVAGTVTLNAVVYNYLTRANGANASGNWHTNSLSGGAGASGFLGAATVLNDIADSSQALNAFPGTHPTGTTVVSTSTTAAAYVDGTFYRDITSVWDPGVANFGIGKIFSYSRGSGGHSHLFATQFTPVIPKTNVQRLTMNTRWTWGRYP